MLATSSDLSFSTSVKKTMTWPQHFGHPSRVNRKRSEAEHSSHLPHRLQRTTRRSLVVKLPFHGPSSFTRCSEWFKAFQDGSASAGANRPSSFTITNTQILAAWVATAQAELLCMVTGRRTRPCVTVRHMLEG